MNENNPVMNTADDWDDMDWSDLAVEEEAVEENEGAAATEADQPTETEAQEPDTFSLKYMDEERRVTREEVVTLAQKGMDYDRVREKYEDAKTRYADYETIKADLAKRNEQIQWLEELARDQGQTLDELVESTQVSIMSKKTGKSPEVCKGIVANQRLERELKAQQAKLAETGSKNAKRDADIDAFLKAYPDWQGKNPDGIPKEVWTAVTQNGESLVSAYRAYEVKELRAQLEKERAEAQKQKQKEENKAHSLGSMSTGGTKQIDPFDAMWYDGT